MPAVMHDPGLSWQRQRNLVAVSSGWQRPAKTEEWVYEQLSVSFPSSRFAEVVCFPWATAIDLSRAGQRARVAPFLDALAAAPPRMRLVRATVCQHIYVKDMLPWLHQLKVTDLYWPHATHDTPRLERIRVHPFPLYPVRCEDLPSVIERGGKPSSERSLLYSFVGAYVRELYLTPVRKRIFELPFRKDAVVAGRDEWHYDGHVYREQVAGLKMTESAQQRYEQYSREYSNLLQESIFSLCPSGSGPNSIRLWESLGYGAIPVILSDSLRLPGAGSEWEAASLRISEDEAAVRRLPALLNELAQDKEQIGRMQRAGRQLWEKYGRMGPSTILGKLTDSRYIATLTR